MFSRRFPADFRPNAIARLRHELAAVPYDLTVSNPTLCGIPYPGSLLAPLGDRRGLVYRPEPLGLREAREAVAREQSRRGRRVVADAVMLTASTSEAYSLLFKLLCDPDEVVLTPAPSYPLFEHLLRLDGIRARPYPLDPRADWQPDPGAADLGGARALIAVHPNNPTGSYVEPEPGRELARFCAGSGLALIADEVFFDYVLDPADDPRSFACTDEVLTFTLGGLSKSLGLPQLKLAWTIVSGPAHEVARALERLELIADHYLSVATPVQLALAELFPAGAPVHRAILERCRTNLAEVRRALAQVPAVELVPPAGGWSAVLRYPNVIEEEVLALELLEQDGVAVYPGYFFDFADRGYLSLSLLPESEIFAGGLSRVLDRIARSL